MKQSLMLLISLFVTALASGVNVPSASLKNTLHVKQHLDQADYSGKTLTIYNSFDYINEDLIDAFEEETGAKVNYYTFDTNETMYNQFTLQPEGTYDLVCTSDYMIQRMIREGLLESVDIAKECPIYDTYASNIVRGKLKSMFADTDNDGIKDTSLDSYAAGYMWGTLGIIYDPYCSDTIKEDVKSWDVFWDPTYRNLISIKNSMRDTFTVGLIHAYSGSNFSNTEDILNPAREEYLNKLKNASNQEEIDTLRAEYNEVVQGILDLVITEENYEDIIDVVNHELIELKKNIFGFEVDSGKNDIVTGKIKMNLAWSGDAVYSIDVAMEQQEKVLEYYVPEEGSNIWYDGWVFPKGCDKELACAFVDFISDPYNASQNMDYTGYTPFITSEEVFNMASDWYGCADYFEGREYYDSVDVDEDGNEIEVDPTLVHYNDKFYVCIKDSINHLPTDEEYFEEVDPEEYVFEEPYDLKFLFEGHISPERNGIIYPLQESQNGLMTQYPDEETIARCAVMNDFEDANNDVVIMWGQIRAYTNMVPYYVILGVSAGIILTFFIYQIVKRHVSSRNKRLLSQKNNHN